MNTTLPRINRRDCLSFGASFGLSQLAARWLSAEDAGQPIRQKANAAKSVIVLFMAGGPSQVDTFDPKPRLQQLEGNDVPESIAAKVPPIKRAGLRNLMASPWKFHRHGESGLEVSELFPKTATHADQLCVLRSMTHRNPVHGPAECVALTGSGAGDRPSLGAWTLFGLGRASDELPAFIAMNLHTNGMQFPQASGWGSGFLPSRFQGTVVDPIGGVRHVTMPKDTEDRRRRAELDVIERMNRRYRDEVGGHSELDARVRSYELAFRMQTAAPELFELKTESQATLQEYGVGQKSMDTVARSCLLARRMVERGVRFIQVRVGGWDAHGNLRGNHSGLAAKTDQPIAALLGDLKRRGLLDSTLVLWGGEFGRTPTMEGRGKGRDHSPVAYSVWLAGGGVQGGRVVGQTDAIGYTVEDRPISPQDLHATVLKSLGVNATELTFDHLGLQESPLGVSGGDAVHEVFAPASD